MHDTPYYKYEGLPAWKIIDQGVSDLVANQDLKEMTVRSHIVGYLVKGLVEAGVVAVGKQGLP